MERVAMRLARGELVPLVHIKCESVSLFTGLLLGISLSVPGMAVGYLKDHRSDGLAGLV